MKKIKFIALLLLLIITIKGWTQEHQLLEIKKDSSADYNWENEPAYPVQRGYILPINPSHAAFLKQKVSFVQSYMEWEMYKRVFRDWGTLLWQKNPNDIRRFAWLRKTIALSPNYFANIFEGAIAKTNKEYLIPLDPISKKKWEEQYQLFREEYMSSSQTNDKERIMLIEAELTYIEGLKWRQNLDDKTNIKEWVAKATEYVVKYKAEKLKVDLLLRSANYFFHHPKDYGLDDKDLKSFIKMLKDSNVPEYLEFAKQKTTLMQLKSNPLRLAEIAVNGNRVNIQDYKGKLVLIDFWSLGCSSCIEKMPEIKEVYERYRNKGFEVISACFVIGDWDRNDGQDFYKDEKKKIEAIHDKIGADWPLVLLERKPGEKRHHIWSTYGFSGVPQFLLLDETGKLIHYNGVISKKGGLEQLIEEHLKNKLKNN